MLEMYDLPSLRAERQRLNDRHEHLSWLRRLIKAREDLEIARLTGLCTSVGDDPQLPARVRAAIALQPSDDDIDLLGDLARSQRLLAHAADSTHEELALAQAELVRRYRQDPASCLRPAPVEAGAATG